MSKRKQNIVDVISLPHENFIFLFIRVLPRSTLNRSAIPFSGIAWPLFNSLTSQGFFWVTVVSLLTAAHA